MYTQHIVKLTSFILFFFQFSSNIKMSSTHHEMCTYTNCVHKNANIQLQTKIILTEVLLTMPNTFPANFLYICCCTSKPFYAFEAVSFPSASCSLSQFLLAAKHPSQPLFLNLSLKGQPLYTKEFLKELSSKSTTWELKIYMIISMF